MKWSQHLRGLAAFLFGCGFLGFLLAASVLLIVRPDAAIVACGRAVWDLVRQLAGA